jgi:hypothetical protein
MLEEKQLITVDCSEVDPENVTYAELSDVDYTALFGSQTANIKKEKCFIFGDVAQGYMA